MKKPLGALLLLASLASSGASSTLTYDPSGNLSARNAGASAGPNIIRQPRLQVVRPGELASFSVIVGDARGVTYQWRFGAVDLGGETNDTVLLANVSGAHEGLYSVLVSNAVGTATSTPVRLYLDTDLDGLPDSWEITYFNSLTFQRGGGDRDGDGASNLDEFLDGTNPNDAASVRYRLTLLSNGGSIAAAPTKHKYASGEVVTLTAIPQPPNAFRGWSGDLSTFSNPVPLTMDTNKTVRARFECGPLPPGVVAFWRGESDANDLAGGHHGAFYSGGVVVAPTLTAAGRVDGAFDFDGAAHVEVPDSPDLKPAQLTAEAWVYPVVVGPFRTVIARGSSINADVAWSLDLLHGTPRFISKHVGTGQDVLQVSLLPANQWTHLAISFDGGTKRLYINGALAAAVGGLGSLVYDPAAVPVTVGANWIFGGSGQGFIGRLDEVTLYNRALGPDEVVSIYLADFVGKCADRPAITSKAQFTDGRASVGYSQQTTAAPGTPPIEFKLSAGTPPPGLSFSTAGVLSGIPTTPGDYVFEVQATDAAGFSSEQVSGLRIHPSLAPPGLIAWWRAEGDSQDAAGANHGILRNGTGFAVGKVGQTFALDGVDDHVEIPDTPELRPASLTLEAWVKFNGTAGVQVIAAKPLGSSYLDSWVVYLAGGFLTGVRCDALGDGPYLSASFAPVIGRWYHLAYTFDDATKRQTVFIDGAQAATGLATRSIGYDNHPILLGMDSEAGVPSYFLNGAIDEATLFSRALSATEIAEIYAVGAAGKATQGPYLNAPDLLPAAIVGVPYSQAFPSLRGTAPYAYTVTGGALPSGLSLSSAGLLSGTPTADGDFEFVVRIRDDVGAFTDQPRVLKVLPHVPPNNAMAWWRAEGNAQDAVGGNHGALQNGTAFTTGMVGQAFSLDGNDDSIDVADAPELRPKSLTLEAWVNFGASNGRRQIFAKPLGGGGSDSFEFWLETTTLFAAVADNSGYGPRLGAAFSPVSGRWYHLAYTFDDASKEQSIYIDGVQVASGIANRTIDYDNHPLLLGRDSESGVPSFHLQGRIDEPAIFDRALSAAEIASIHAAGAAGKTTLGPYFTTAPLLPEARRGQAYAQAIVSERGTPTVVYSLVGGTSIPGLAFSVAGQFTGAPTQVGNYNLEVRATDGAGRYAEQWFTLPVLEEVVPAPGLLAWWRAENNGEDSAGANDGVVQSGADFAAGRVGQAFRLNGTSGFIEVPDAPTLRPASLTLEAWIRVEAIGTVGVVFAKPVGGGSSDSFAVWVDNAGFLRSAMGDGTGMGPTLNGPSALTPGRWYHVAYTFQNPGLQQALYLDGTLVASGVSERSMGYDAQPVLLGRDTESGIPSYYFNGRIDEASIYGRALSAAEIALISSVGAAGKSPTAVLFNAAAAPSLIPGKVEAEDYGTGGSGISFLDGTTGNAGGAYRTDGVDIELCQDVDDGYDVSSIWAGEWLKYSVQVQTTGAYDMVFRVAGDHLPGSIRASVDGRVLGTFPIPTTGGPQSWGDVVVPNTYLSAGTQTLWLEFVAGSFALNYTRFDLTASIGPPVVSTTTLPDGNVASSYSQTLIHTGGAPAFTWTLSSGSLPDGLTLAASGLIAGTPTATGTANFTVEVEDVLGQTGQKALAIVVNPRLPSQIMARHVFYNQSAWDGNDANANAGDDTAVATDKQALRPGFKATFANYTGYRHGLNGLMVDIAGAPGPMTAADFVFRVGNDQTPASWPAAPSPVLPITVRPSPEFPGAERVTVIWANSAIKKQWLEVRILANAITGLVADDVFYFGNAIGETGNSAADARVTSADALRVLGNVTASAPLVSRFDHNRDGRVGAADRLLVLGNISALTPLVLLDLTGGGAAPALAQPEFTGPWRGMFSRVPFGLRVQWIGEGEAVRIWTAEAAENAGWEIFDERAGGGAVELFLPVDFDERGRMYRLNTLRQE